MSARNIQIPFICVHAPKEKKNKIVYSSRNAANDIISCYIKFHPVLSLLISFFGEFTLNCFGLGRKCGNS